jgi:hypothetical protein
MSKSWCPRVASVFDADVSTLTWVCKYRRGLRRRAHASLTRSGMILAWGGNGVSDSEHSAHVMKVETGATR